MESGGSLPHSQKPTDSPYPESDRYSQGPITLLEYYKIILPSMTRSLKRSLSFGFPRKDPLCTSMWKSHGKFVDVTEDVTWSSHWALNVWKPPPLGPIMNPYSKTN
jgi:hypothetical protein